jgi:hypothetical protein
VDGGDASEAFEFEATELNLDLDASIESQLSKVRKALPEGYYLENAWSNGTALVSKWDEGGDTYWLFTFEFLDGEVNVTSQVQVERQTVYTLAYDEAVIQIKSVLARLGHDQKGVELAESLVTGIQGILEPSPEHDGGEEVERGVLIKLLQLSEDATDDDINRRVQELQDVGKQAGVEEFRASDEYRTLVADATAGREASKAIYAMRRDSIIDKAEAEGRITPGERQEWVELYDEAPAKTESLIAKLPVVVQLGERGDGSTEETAGEEKFDEDAIAKEANLYFEEHKGEGIELEDAYMVVLQKHGKA